MKTTRTWVARRHRFWMKLCRIAGKVLLSRPISYLWTPRFGMFIFLWSEDGSLEYARAEIKGFKESKV